MTSTVTNPPLSLIINKHDDHPMLHLFSPTTLTGDLVYVDKTYYSLDNISSSNNNNNINNNQKAMDNSQLSIHSIMLNKTVGLLTGIRKLDLRRLDLLLLPSQISHLSHLTLLDLSYNQLTNLPSSLKQLKQLRYLNLSHNQFDHLPPVICQLPKLTSLDLSHNSHLSYLPRSLAHVRRLIHLDISYTDIAAFPIELSSLITIRYDHCSRLITNLEGFDDELVHHPPSLVELCVRKIMSLPNYSSVLKLRLQQQQEKCDHEEKEKENKKEKKETKTDYYHHHEYKKEKKKNYMMLKQKLKNTWYSKNKIKSTIYNRHYHHHHSSSNLPTSPALLQLPNHLWDYMLQAQHCSFCGKLFVKDYVFRYRIIQRLDESFLPIYYQLCCAHWSNESDRLLIQFSTPS